MVRFLTRPMDRLAMRSAGRSIPKQPVGPHNAAEASARVRQPRFFDGAGPWLKGLSFGAGEDFVFPSVFPSRWAENGQVHGKFFRAGPDWSRRPAVVLLHGWNGEAGYRWQFPLLARRLSRAGLNVGMIELPYHGRRKPRAPGAIRNFISHDLLAVVEAVEQSLADIRALLGWILGQGCPAVGVWGMSLGAWLAGLLASHEPRTAFAVLLTPVVRMDRALLELPFCEPIRRGLQGAGVGLDPLNLIWHPPPDPERLLILESEYDLFSPKETVEELWETWGKPEIWRFRHGHISILFSWRILSRTVRWIARKARVEEVGEACLRGGG